VTYAELWRQVAAVMRGFSRLELHRGDRVAVYADKRMEPVVAMFAAAGCGGIFVPVNPVLRPWQVGHILADCAARVLVTTSARLDVLRSELARCPSVEYVVVVGPAPEVPPGPQVVRWDDLHDDGVVPSDTASGTDIDPVAIFYTSGSTGRAKGVVVSHRNLVVGAESVSQYLRNNVDDTILALLPLSFDAGFSQLTTGFLVGAQVVLADYRLAGEVVRLCARHQVTGLTCVPPLWIQLAEARWPASATTSMRYFANTGGRLPKTTLDRLREIFPKADPFLMYGLTEAFRSTYLDPAEVDRRPDSIGKAVPNAEVMVVRPDGTPCLPGEEGELVHRGPLVALGYWNAPEATAERFRPAPGSSGDPPDVAVWSGDVVVRDAEGFLFFVGRRDELIKSSGYRISPGEIEEATRDTGLVSDAVAMGADDDRLGQHVVLVVSPAGGRDLQPEALLEKLRRRLPRYMVPKRIIVRPDLPRSPNGKCDRAALREEYAG
jgi:acyl-CoA ligase (AMP-forming) (exosortase A-associated)